MSTMRPQREELGRLLRYIISGGSAALVELLLFALLTGPLHLQPVLSHAAVYTVTFWMSFLLNKFWTFKSRHNFLPQLIKYAVLFAFNLVLTSLVLSALTALGLHAIAAKLAVMVLVVCWNFIAYKFFIYK